MSRRAAVSPDWNHLTARNRPRHAAGAAEPPFDGRLVCLGAVGHDDLGSLAPFVPLSGQEPRQRLGVAVGNHGEHLAGVAVHQHRHTAAPTADRGLIDQQQPASSPAAMPADQPRPSDHQRVHQIPAQPAPTGRRVDRHRPRVGHHTTRQPARETALERRMILAETTPARPAHQPPPLPHQRGRPARHPQVAHLVVTTVMSPPARRPAVRALQAPHHRHDPHHQPTRRVDHHPGHPDLRQPQPHRHNISRHRGPPGPASHEHRPQQGLDPHPRTLNPPSPQKNAKNQQPTSQVEAELGFAALVGTHQAGCQGVARHRTGHRSGDVGGADRYRVLSGLRLAIHRILSQTLARGHSTM